MKNPANASKVYLKITAFNEFQVALKGSIGKEGTYYNHLCIIVYLFTFSY